MYDVIIVGGGQAGLSMAYFTKRITDNYLVVDNQDQPGGSWLHTWNSLRLFSPTEYSSLSGWAMPKGAEEYPTKKDFINYLTAYEERYKFPIRRGVQVESVTWVNNVYIVALNNGEVLETKALVSCTGTSSGPFIPTYKGAELFKGSQIHSINYQSPKDFMGKKTLVVGAGNTGAQLVSELRTEGVNTTWTSLHEPEFLPDDVDGRYLFDNYNKKYFEQKHHAPQKSEFSLSQIVMVEPVKKAREKGLLYSRLAHFEFTENGVLWLDTQENENIHAVIWCTGFKPYIPFLKSFHLEQPSAQNTEMTQAKNQKGLWLVGYGNFTGYASATIYGVGKTARETAKEMETYLNHWTF